MTDFSGPSGQTDRILDDVRFELMSLNLQMRDLVELERQEREVGVPTASPTIVVDGPDVDLNPLIAALESARPSVDMGPVISALQTLESRVSTGHSEAILAALAQLQKSFDDLGVGMRAIAGSMGGGGGAVYLAADQTMKVQDKYTDAEFLNDQAGSGTVLTFTFSKPVQLVFVRSNGGICRAAGNVTPSATLGAYCGDGETTAIPREMGAIQVYAPSGATVSVWGFRY